MAFFSPIDDPRAFYAGLTWLLVSISFSLRCICSPLMFKAFAVVNILRTETTERTAALGISCAVRRISRQAHCTYVDSLCARS
jgi:hypothetical protein